MQANVQSIQSGPLLEEYRDILLKLGADRTNRALARRADLLEEEISKRMAW